MSWLPVYLSFSGALILVSVFLWSGLGLVLSLFLVFWCLPYLLGEVYLSPYRRSFSFLVFLSSEALVFLSLFVTVLWFEDSLVDSISYWGGLPAVGCVLLINSSLAVSVFHSRVEEGGWVYLLLGMMEGLGFVALQGWEMWECRCDMSFCSYYSSVFSTVGLHFFHVVLGLGLLVYLYKNLEFVKYYYLTLMIWYWHFVDYIWLFVYVVAYML